MFIRKWCQKWPCILFEAIYRENSGLSQTTRVIIHWFYLTQKNEPCVKWSFKTFWLLKPKCWMSQKDSQTTYKLYWLLTTCRLGAIDARKTTFAKLKSCKNWSHSGVASPFLWTGSESRVGKKSLRFSSFASRWLPFLQCVSLLGGSWELIEIPLCYMTFVFQPSTPTYNSK